MGSQLCWNQISTQRVHRAHGAQLVDLIHTTDRLDLLLTEAIPRTLGVGDLLLEGCQVVRITGNLGPFCDPGAVGPLSDCDQPLDHLGTARLHGAVAHIGVQSTQGRIAHSTTRSSTKSGTTATRSASCFFVDVIRKLLWYLAARTRVHLRLSEVTVHQACAR